jgi:hypothetical protein
MGGEIKAKSLGEEVTLSIVLPQGIQFIDRV